MQSIMHSYTQEEEELLGTINSVIIAISVAGCFFNAITSLYLQNTHVTLTKMVLALCMMDLLNDSLTFILLRVKVSEGFCWASNIMLWFSWGGALAWTCCFAYSLYITAKDISVHNVSKCLPKFAGASIVISLIMASIAFGFRFNDLDHESYCTFEFNEKALKTVAVVSVLSIIYCLYCYLTVIKLFKRKLNALHLELLVYPGILVLCLVPLVLETLYLIMENDWPPFYFHLIQSIAFNLQGLLNAFAYGLSRRIKDGCGERWRGRTPREEDSSFVETDGNDNEIARGLSLNEEAIKTPNHRDVLNQDLHRYTC